MAPKWMPAIESACSDSRLIVLGGDIFDFRWARLGGHQATLAASKQWLGSLIEKHPHATIVYIMGNHDSHPDMCQLLSELAKHIATSCGDQNAIRSPIVCSVMATYWMLVASPIS